MRHDGLQDLPEGCSLSEANPLHQHHRENANEHSQTAHSPSASEALLAALKSGAPSMDINAGRLPQQRQEKPKTLAMGRPKYEDKETQNPEPGLPENERGETDKETFRASRKGGTWPTNWGLHHPDGPRPTVAPKSPIWQSRHTSPCAAHLRLGPTKDRAAAWLAIWRARWMWAQRQTTACEASMEKKCDALLYRVDQVAGSGRKKLQ